MLAAGFEDDNTTQIWDATTGQHLYTFKGLTGYVKVAAWSPRGHRLASASNETVHVWDATSGMLLATYTGWGYVEAVAWSPDGAKLASWTNVDTIQVWDATTHQHLFVCKGHSSAIKAAAWSPDGCQLVSVSGDKTIQIWDTCTGQRLSCTNLSENEFDLGIGAAAWSSDRHMLAFEDGEIVQICNIANGQHLSINTGHSKAITSLVW